MAVAPGAGSLVARVTRLLDDLPPTERRLAEFLIDFPGELPSYTATELAAAARVSNAAVTRFIRKLGYDSYGDARRQVRLEQKSGSPLLLLGAEGKAAGTLRAHLELSIQNLSETYAGLSEDMLDRIAHAMIAANRVWIAGFRNNYSFAAYLRWQVFRVLETSILLPTSGETIAEYAVSIRKGDMLVVFALRRSLPASTLLIASAVKSGAEVLCVTDETVDDPGPATWLVRCRAKAAGALDNHVAVIGLAHFLATRVLELTGRSGRRRLAEIETMHDLLGELP